MTSFSDLQRLASNIVQLTQTGALSKHLGLNIVSIDIRDPIAPPVDPTGGVRATKETGDYALL